MVVKKYCAFGGCKRLVNLNERYCSKHKPKDSHTNKSSDYANEIHSSSRWRRTSLLYREANPICEQCLHEASKEAGMVNLATSVDHIVPLFAGGEPYDWSNLQSLCDYHHSFYFIYFFKNICNLKSLTHVRLLKKGNYYIRR